MTGESRKLLPYHRFMANHNHTEFENVLERKQLQLLWSLVECGFTKFHFVLILGHKNRQDFVKSHLKLADHNIIVMGS